MIGSVTGDKVLISAKLRKLTDKWQDIINVLDHSTILIGGLVLQSVLGDKWDTDIDIFTTNYNFNRFDFGMWKETTLVSKYTMIPGVIRTFKGFYNGLTIDIIHITSVPELFRGFDFDFCKTWFDGERIRMANPDSVLNKTCTVSLNDVTLRNIDERILKYEARGFTINRV